jgi:lycopene cyclase CruP
MQHFTLLAGYDLGNRLNPLLTPLIRNLLPEQQFTLNCQLKAWKYGSGGDFSTLN